MTSLLPWLALAGAGALHGLNPATGWMFAAVWGARQHDQPRAPGQALRALLPLAAGHAVSVALVACSVALGLGMNRMALQSVAMMLLIGVAAMHWRGRHGSIEYLPMPTGHAGLMLWSFIMSTAHGAGMMLVPALIPLCLRDSPAREITASGSLALALAAVAVHAAAMLAVTWAIASLAGRGVHAGAYFLRRLRRAQVPAPH